MQEYYHNSSWLENGGSPEKAARSALTSAIDAYIKQQGKYNKNESSIKWQDVQDCLVLVTNCFSTQTSYENQTKKAINNRFIQQAMTAFFKERLATYLIENKDAKNESSIKWQDVQDCLVLVTNCFSTQTSYENQTKKAINNRFIQQAMTAFFKERLATYLIENKDAANKIMEQVLINKRSRQQALARERREDPSEHQDQPAAKD